MSSDQQRVRELAYRLWEERGRPERHAEQDWFAAERLLAGQAGGASQAADALPKRPPANVEVQLDAVNERAGKKPGAAAQPAAGAKRGSPPAGSTRRRSAAKQQDGAGNDSGP